MLLKLTDAEAEYLASLVDADLERIASHPASEARNQKEARLQKFRERLGSSLECANEKCASWFFTTRSDRFYCSARCSDQQTQRSLRRRVKSTSGDCPCQQCVK